MIVEGRELAEIAITIAMLAANPTFIRVKAVPFATPLFRGLTVLKIPEIIGVHTKPPPNPTITRSKSMYQTGDCPEDIALLSASVENPSTSAPTIPSSAGHLSRSNNRPANGFESNRERGNKKTGSNCREAFDRLEVERHDEGNPKVRYLKDPETHSSKNKRFVISQLYIDQRIRRFLL